MRPDKKKLLFFQYIFDCNKKRHTTLKHIMYKKYRLKN